MVLCIANTHFELELGSDERQSIVDALEKNPIALQLQYLPLIYAHSSDTCLATTLPPKESLEKLLAVLPKIPKIATFDDQFENNLEISAWGYSQQIQNWAKSKNLEISMPDLEIVKKVNSKAFSFEIFPTFNDASLVKNQMELELWLDSHTEPVVFKSCFGLSGRGHFILIERTNERMELLQAFCKTQWVQRLPVLAEPWVERCLDFSTQWEILPSGDISFLGAVTFESDHKGVYRSTLVGQEEILFKFYAAELVNHKKEALKALQILYKEGYWGFVGIDAMIYTNKQQKPSLVPIVEINARKTMSQVALQLQQNLNFGNCMRLSYESKKQQPGLLPEYAFLRNGKRVNFKKQLYYERMKRT